MTWTKDFIAKQHEYLADYMTVYQPNVEDADSDCEGPGYGLRLWVCGERWRREGGPDWKLYDGGSDLPDCIASGNKPLPSVVDAIYMRDCHTKMLRGFYVDTIDDSIVIRRVETHELVARLYDRESAEFVVCALNVAIAQ